MFWFSLALLLHASIIVSSYAFNEAHRYYEYLVKYPRVEWNIQELSEISNFTYENLVLYGNSWMLHSFWYDVYDMINTCRGVKAGLQNDARPCVA